MDDGTLNVKKEGKMADFFIVGAIILAVILSVLYLIKQARSGKGCCGGCAGCSKACARRKEEK